MDQSVVSERRTEPPRMPDAVGVQEMDPVCGMKVNAATSEHSFDHGGKTFHFCSAGCRTKFAASPKIYIKPKVATAGAAKAGSIYTCPMHPQSGNTVRAIAPSAA